MPGGRRFNPVSPTRSKAPRVAGSGVPPELTRTELRPGRPHQPRPEIIAHEARPEPRGPSQTAGRRGRHRPALGSRRDLYPGRCPDPPTPGASHARPLAGEGTLDGLRGIADRGTCSVCWSGARVGGGRRAGCWSGVDGRGRHVGGGRHAARRRRDRAGATTPIPAGACTRVAVAATRSTSSSRSSRARSGRRWRSSCTATSSSPATTRWTRSSGTRCRKGNVVISPRWQTGFEPCPGPVHHRAGMTAAVNGIRGGLKYLRDGEHRVKPRLDETSYFGFSPEASSRPTSRTGTRHWTRPSRGPSSSTTRTTAASPAPNSSWQRAVRNARTHPEREPGPRPHPCQQARHPGAVLEARRVRRPQPRRCCRRRLRLEPLLEGLGRAATVRVSPGALPLRAGRHARASQPREVERRHAIIPLKIQDAAPIAP